MLRIQSLQNTLNYTSSYSKIEVERLGPVSVITLNSPKDLNALTAKMREEITQVVREIDLDDSVKVVVFLSKVEKAFCAGADISEFLTASFENEITHQTFDNLQNALGQLRKVMISGLNGVSLGGGLELALFSDILICSEEARMGLPELKLGLIPGIHGTQRLTKLIGKTSAMRYILTSDYFNAQQALVCTKSNNLSKQMGVVSQIVKRENLREECLKLANKVADKSLYTLIVGKEAVKAAEELGLAQGIRYEKFLFSALHNTKGPKEGAKAFFEKRAPDFSKI